MLLLRHIAALLITLLSLAACGGGGGGGATRDVPGAVTKTTLSGIATKGPFTKDSTVNVYAVTNGVKGALITQAKTTDDNGNYSADLGSYTGPIIVEVSGSYHDEATGNTITVSTDSPLRAVLPQAQGAVTLPVTPLTELAVQKTGGVLTQDTITTANTLVSTIFKVDIINIMPVTPAATALDGATQAQKDYTLALAAVSQLASGSSGTSDTDKLKSALSTLSAGISAAGMNTDTVATFQAALSDFVSPTNSKNKTGINDISATSLVNVGTLSSKYTLALQGDISAGAVKGIQFDLVLPAGVTVNINSSDSTVLSSSLALSGGTPPDALLAASFSSGVMSVGLITTQGASAGGFATFTCNIAPGASAPAASAFVLKNIKVVDGKGNTLAGMSVLLQ